MSKSKRMHLIPIPTYILHFSLPRDVPAVLPQTVISFLRIVAFPLLRGKAAAVGRPIAASDHDPVWRFLLPDRYLTKSRKWYLYTVPLGKKANIKNLMSARIAKIHLNSFLEET